MIFLFKNVLHSPAVLSYSNILKNNVMSCYKFSSVTCKTIRYDKTFNVIKWNMLRCYSEIPQSKRKPGSKKGPITWKSLAVTFGIGSILFLGMYYTKKEKEAKITKERSRALGKAAIGGTWELIDHNGKARSYKEYLGQWVLLYFGFTHCPDICPDEIEKMINAIEILRKNPSVSKISPLFITIDPERDNIQALASYVKEFSSELLGLTGTIEQIQQVAKAFRVYYSAGPKDFENDYIVDHTIIMYLIDPEGKFLDYYGQNKTAEEISSSITLHMIKYKK